MKILFDIIIQYLLWKDLLWDIYEILSYLEDINDDLLELNHDFFGTKFYHFKNYIVVHFFFQRRLPFVSTFKRQLI